MKRITGRLSVLTLMLILCACTAAQPEAPKEKYFQSPTWQEQYDLGIRYLSEGNYQEAIIAFTAAIKIDPKQAPAYVGRGDSYVLSGETEQNLAAAKADYEMAIELDEAIVEAYLGLVDVYIRQRDYEKAMEVLREGQKKNDDSHLIADKIAEVEAGIFADSSGWIRRRNTYDAEGNLKYYHIYSRDELGREISDSFTGDGVCYQHRETEYSDDGSSITRNYDGDGVLDSIWIDDPQGRVREEYYYNGALNIYREFAHDEENRGTGYTEYNADGTVRQRSEYEFDESGRVIRSIDYDGSGNITRFVEETYNEFGQHIRQSYFYGDGTLNYYYEFAYDENGTMVSQTEYDAEGNVRNAYLYVDES